MRKNSIKYLKAKVRFLDEQIDNLYQQQLTIELKISELRRK